MLTVADIMTTKLITLGPEATLRDAHNITKEKGIRHIPIVDSDNKLLAIVTQKVLIANVMQILSDYGEQAIERKEKHTDVLNVAETDFDTVKPNRPIVDVAEFFLFNKHGCLPVVDDENKILGIITSSDFVRLSIKLLSQ
jgi:CBS-domain-containing membrane protein